MNRVVQYQTLIGWASLPSFRHEPFLHQNDVTMQYGNQNPTTALTIYYWIFSPRIQQNTDILSFFFLYPCSVESVRQDTRFLRETWYLSYG